MTRKEVTQLVRSLKAEGLVTDTEVTGNGHLRLHLPNGTSVISPRTPGDRRSLLNVRADVKRALRSTTTQEPTTMPTDTLHRPEPQAKPVTGPRSRIIAKVVTRYTTTDGQEYDTEHMALEHQRVVDFADVVGVDADLPSPDPIGLGEWLIENKALVLELLEG